MYHIITRGPTMMMFLIVIKHLNHANKVILYVTKFINNFQNTIRN